MKKRVLGVIAAAFLLVTLLPLTVRAADNVWAILYEDGTLVFQDSNTPESGRKVKETYEVDLNANYTHDIHAPWYNARESVRVVNFADKISPTSTAYWFYCFWYLQRVNNIQNLDTSNVVNMNSMFNGCNDLEALNVTHFNTANVTDMGMMFASCHKLTELDISHFDTANVTDMRAMFASCYELAMLDLSHFNTANVTAMTSMFADCTKLKAIHASDKFITVSVTKSNDMFKECTSLIGGNKTAFDSSHIDAEYARIDTASTPGYFTYKAPAPIPDDVYAILYEDGTLVFQNSDTPESGRKVTKTYEVDLTAVYTWDDDIQRPNTPWYDERESIRVVNFMDKISPTATAYWFFSCEHLKRVDNIQNLDTANVTDMSAMFYFCSELTTLDVSHFDTAKVTNMRGMFSSSRLTTLDLSHFDTANVTDMNRMFSGCGELTTLDVSKFDTANVTDMDGMFSNCARLTALDVSHFNTANVTDMRAMFGFCNMLTALDVSHFNTANVTDMRGMFNFCSGLTTLDVSHFNTANVTDMKEMFYNCNKLTALDVSHFDTANVKDMLLMFADCSKLTTIYASDKFTTVNASGVFMFSNCELLVGGNGTKYAIAHTDKEYARIDTASAPGYFTDKNAPAYTVSGTQNGNEYKVTLTNPAPVTVAVMYFDAGGKFLSAAIKDVEANAGSVSFPLTAAHTTRVTLLGVDYRPLCVYG